MCLIFVLFNLDIDQNESDGECRDALPKPFSNSNKCKELNVTCKKLRRKCNSRLGNRKEILGSSNSSKKCIKRLTRQESNARVRSFCKMTCNQCNK